METWNFEELRELCRKNTICEETISKFTNFANSLAWRYQRAKFHAEQAHNILKDLFSQTFTFGDEKSSVAVFSYEAYVEACVQSLHSMGDILGQIINVVILQDKFSEDKASLNNVINYMINNDVASDITSKMNKLICSNEFCYINAFCNTIKHRRLIETEFRL